MARISKTQLEKLQKKYKTDDAIGKLYGITRQAVHQLRVKYGIEAVADKYDERNAEIAKAYAGGVSGTKLSKKYDLSISQVYRIINSSSDAKPAAKKAAKKSAKKVAKVVKVAKPAAKPVAKKAAKKAAKKK